MALTPQFEHDTSEHDDLREEQWYWNSNDGDLFLLLEDREDEVTIATIDGSVELYPKEDMIFNADQIGKTIHPVTFTRFGDTNLW